MSQQPRPKPSVSTGRRPLLGNTSSVYAFPNASTNEAPQTITSLLPNPWEDSQSRSRPRVRSMNEPRTHPPQIPQINLDTPITFPQPQLLQPSRSDSSHLNPPSRSLQHRHSKSEFRSQRGQSVQFRRTGSRASTSRAMGENEHHFESRGNGTEKLLLESMNGNTEAALRAFQEDRLNDEDQEWHRLVPKEAQAALGKKEVHRQSVVFEIIKGERDYVSDLELVQQLFIDGLRDARPPIIRDENNLSSFLKNVFGNFYEILDFHRRLLGALFARQREQHPLLHSVADVVLDTIVRTEFRSAYETYIKHYPLAESYHRKELKRNRVYEDFVQSASNDPRARKRDLITFLSRPVTRLPRLNLLLDQTLKSTERDFEHPDLEALPLILGILSDCIKSTQPGIEAAESKVKFWALCESLVYQKGEIIDMDLYDQSRTLVYTNSVTRRIRSDAGFHEWNDLTACLLDNYLLLAKEEKQPKTSSFKRHLTSRPLHLSYLRLGNFTDTPDTRKEKNEDGGLLGSFRSQTVPVFPFTIYHASSRSTRRYTLYAATDAQRQKWRSTLLNAIAVHRVREESGKWFDPQSLSSRFFGIPSPTSLPSSAPAFSGKITSAAPFTIFGRKYLAVGCLRGIFVSPAGNDSFKKVLPYSNPRYIFALQALGDKVFNRFIVHSESIVISYSLESLVRLALGQSPPEALEASMEKTGGDETSIVLCKCIQLGGRAMVICASKKRLSSTLTLQVFEAVTQAEKETMARKNNILMPSFRPLGEPGFIPRDAHDVVTLKKSIGICTQDGIAIMDPINLSRSSVTLVPNLYDAMSSLAMSNLKERINEARPLGLARVNVRELLVVYDCIGCYITNDGFPSRSCGYIRWETPADGYAHRGDHILLVSSQFIEIRSVITGRIVQVIEGIDVRLMYSSFSTGDKDDRVLIATRGDRKGKDGGHADKILELVETVEYVPQTPGVELPTVDMWGEWDM